MARGRILKSLAGFYYVIPDNDEVLPVAPLSGGATYQCRARGVFRKNGMKPLVGDRVEFELTETEDVEGNVTALLPRKNSLVRPSVANVDQALVIFAVKNPDPIPDLLDRFLLLMKVSSLPVILNFNKEDLADQDEMERLKENYRDAGVTIHFTSCADGSGIDELKKMLEGKTTTVAGPSGAGKSSIVNELSGEQAMETGEISRKIRRGKQTTRHVELLRIAPDSYIIDTPGFSSLMLPDLEAEELEKYFPEFDEYRGNCYFNSCVHVHEPNCAVRAALEKGEFSEERYRSYVSFFEELKQRKKY